MKSLKEALFDEYGFADKRIKRLERGTSFIVDDRRPQDFGADRRPLSYFCTILVDVPSPTALRVALRGNVPRSTNVELWIRAHGAEFRDAPEQSLEFEVPQGRQEILRSLAAAVRSIVAQGAPRYSVPSYKYVCPRTALSLERLARVLDTAWAR